MESVSWQSGSPWNTTASVSNQFSCSTRDLSTYRKTTIFLPPTQSSIKRMSLSTTNDDRRMQMRCTHNNHTQQLESDVFRGSSRLVSLSNTEHSIPSGVHEPSSFVEISQETHEQSPGQVLDSCSNQNTAFIPTSVAAIAFCNDRQLASGYSPGQHQYDSVSEYRCLPPSASSVCGSMSSVAQYLQEEATSKRQMHLMKNREAARVCRRKKKEYVSCLEFRIGVLENQNRFLVEELRSLRELFQFRTDTLP